jgi:hypothetical protein
MGPSSRGLTTARPETDSEGMGLRGRLLDLLFGDVADSDERLAPRRVRREVARARAKSDGGSNWTDGDRHPGRPMSLEDAASVEQTLHGESHLGGS